MLFGTILSISPATEITFHPPGIDMPSGRMPTKPQAVGRQGFTPPIVNAMPAHGTTSAMDEMVKNMPRLGRMPQDIPFTDNISSVMPPVSKLPQELSSQKKVDCSMDCASTRPTEVPPAMSSLSSLPLGTFLKQNTNTGVSNRENPSGSLK